MLKNTVKKGKFRILIYKGKEGYVGICYEAGWIDIFDTAEETKKHLTDGFIALLKSVKKGDLSEKALNQKPSLKYRMLFFVLPILFSFSRTADISFFTEPISPQGFAHATT